jgi:hypothetical protein
MKSNKEKKQPLRTFFYSRSKLTTYLPNQIQTTGFGQVKNFQPWLAYYILTQMVEDSKFLSIKFSNLPIEVILVGN